MAQQWFIRQQEDVIGPFSVKQLQDMAAEGQLVPTTVVSCDRNQWIDANQVQWLAFGTGTVADPPSREPPTNEQTKRVQRLALVAVLILGAASYFGFARQPPRVHNGRLRPVAPLRPSRLRAERASRRPAPSAHDGDVAIKAAVPKPKPKQRPAPQISAQWRLTATPPPPAKPTNEIITKADDTAPAKQFVATAVDPPLNTELAAKPPSEEQPERSPDKKPQLKVVDFNATMENAGYHEVDTDSLVRYVRFGTAKDAAAALAGDEFDRLERERAAESRLEDSKDKLLLLKGLKVSRVDKGHLDRDGLLVCCSLPLRVEDRAVAADCNGAVSDAHLDSSAHQEGPAALGMMWYLTKDRTLKPCQTVMAAQQVVANNGVLYRGESNTTDLILIIGDLDKAKQVARSPGDYSIDIVISDLRRERPSHWGFYQEAAFHKHLRDCEYLRRYVPSPTGAAMPDPDAIPLFFEPNMPEEKIPMQDVLFRVYIDPNGQISLDLFGEQPVQCDGTTDMEQKILAFMARPDVRAKMAALRDLIR